MSVPAAPLRLFAAATRPEQAAIAKGGELIRRALHEAGASAIAPIELRLAAPPEAPGATALPEIAPDIAPDIAITSPLADLARPEAAPQAAFARWADYLRALQDQGATVFVCTAFRHVPPDIGPTPATREALVARIRRMNLLAIELSHRLAINVIDIDSRLAFHGARWVSGDFRLGTPRAVLAAGHAVAQALLAHGLDGFAAPALQEKALAWLAAPDRLPALLAAEAPVPRPEIALPPQSAPAQTAPALSTRPQTAGPRA
ncbi:MAG: hypothetical protein IT550_04890 [Novosphingobium sp.]|nr:hypothetical protein [Novosphingobium sp.]